MENKQTAGQGTAPGGGAYRFHDDKSDKFWRLEYADNAYVVNYGKTGTTGKYQLKEFDDPATCEQEACKLIASKVKKGYQPYPEFDPDTHFYFDDKEIDIHPLTSHPAYRAHFTADIYYDQGDEETPFGSDEGSDTLAFIEEEIRKGKEFDFAAYPRKLIEEDWEMTYIPADDLSRETVERLAHEDEMNLLQSDLVTYAVAFAQIKITGRVDAGLKAAALAAMRRMEILSDILGWSPTGQPSEITMRMIADLEAFPAR
jgi:uncharacterized protein YfeS